ncbi:hypothetical protein [Nitratifractor sp.]
MKRLKTIVRILMRDLSRKLSEERLEHYGETFERSEQVIKQRRNDKKRHHHRRNSPRNKPKLCISQHAICIDHRRHGPRI